MRRSTVTAGTSTLLAAALLASVAACSAGGDDDGAKPKSTPTPSERPVKVPDTPVSRAAAKSADGSARIDETIRLTSQGSTLTISVAGPFDMAGDKGKLSVESPGGEIDHVDEIFGGGKVYLRPLDDLGKKKWAVVDRDQAKAHFMLRAPLNDPEHVLRQISTMRHVAEKGSEKIGGAATTRYTGTLDHATLSMRLEATTRGKLDALRQKQGKDLPVVADAWVDGKGRLVRARMSWHMGDMTGRITMDLSGFGVKVKAPVPDSSATVPVEAPEGLLLG
ncbi:hypothetical protein [Streptomyces sp. XD-27]|uniref:hypothetical protein n=1 Tax=Streptomyces sp. XD-27 TaxID=3062779 RepID=UPI0026F478DF|nr:hypothetical protein [Streptomyces sp. XD-27]WKX72042.1 hypothetical protein Q3Y56_20950 [Streptomyces sp. XD-27]